MTPAPINVAQYNIALATPEMVLLGLLCLLMVVHLFWRKEDQEGRLLLSALGILVVTAVLVAITAMPVASSTVMNSESIAPPTRFAFSNMFVVDAMASLLKLAVLIAVAVMIVYSRTYLALRNLFTGEFICLILFATLGMMVMVSANHFVTLYLGLELLALSSYALVALNRDSARSTEAAMKYFILGALASGLLLYGISMVYGATGSLSVSVVAKTVAASRANDPLLTFGIVFIVAGLAFKLGVVPFHMWVPDVYEGAPTAMTLFIGSAPKIAAFGFIMRILADALGSAVADWQAMLVILAVLSLAIGNIAAIAQTNLKRMLAYSTISHMGFLLLGVLAGTKNGYASSMFYVMAYVLMTLGAFGMIMLLSRAGFEAEEIDDFKGLNKRSPFYAVLMLFIMFSMAGIPPFIGFWAKLAVLEGALNAGYTWLVVFAVLMSVIGAFYYLRLVKVMYFDEPSDVAPITAPFEMRALLTINAFAIVALGLFPGALMTACLNAIQRSF
jgi:NADH-quinone oxidoreductase subunit N